MTNLKYQIIESRTQADLNAICQHDNYDTILDKIKNLSIRGKEDLIAHLNIIVLADSKHENVSKITQADKKKNGTIIPIDFMKNTSQKQREEVQL